VNPPSSGKRNYWTHAEKPRSPDDWLEGATSHAGSWWPHWYRWLEHHKGGERPAPSRPGSDDYPPLGPAPGTYVGEKVV
jgi:polyhydroxyalkanoate synthase